MYFNFNNKPQQLEWFVQLLLLPASDPL
jgi:hypothetical protein